MNNILWSNKARKQLKKIPLTFREKIVDSTRGLAEFPDCPNVKPLTNHQYGYRLRVGRYRVLFDHEDAVRIIAIQEVKKRDERTY